MGDTNQRLFDAFSAPDETAWQAALEKALKGKPAADLDWQTHGFTMPPAVRNAAPSTRSASVSAGNAWQITEAIALATDPKSANKASLQALWNGVESLRFDDQPGSREDLNTLLHEILIEIIPLRFKASNPTALAEWLELERQSRQLEPAALHGSLGYDPLGKAAFEGGWFQSKEHDFEACGRTMRTLADKLPNVRTITINGSWYHEAGATVVQELAITLAQASEYMAQLCSKSHNADSVASALDFSLAVGNLYFPEIAKLRALRLLWPAIAEQYGADAKSVHVHLHSTTSPWTLSVYDAWNNMLRGTSQAMAAVLGGCNSLEVAAYDAAYTTPNDFSQRVARNVQHVLREEAYFGKVADPAGGSRYVESLTQNIAGAALALFQTIEAKGGFLACLQSGFLQEQIATSAASQKEAVENGSLVFLGVNKHPNLGEKMAEKITTTAPQNEVDAQPEFSPIPRFRATAALDDARLAAEKTTVPNNA